MTDEKDTQSSSSCIFFAAIFMAWNVIKDVLFN
jgi:hypothetical protein